MAIERRWLPLNALRAFEAVATHLSFTAAANSLMVSQSSVSRHVLGLEALLGAPLFERRPHQLVLTDAGRSLLPAVSKSLERIEHAMSDIMEDSRGTKRTLRIDMPPTFAIRLAVPILRDFRADYPDIVLDIESPSGLGGSVREVDVAVTYSRPEVSEHVTDLLWMARPTILCHPVIAARAGSGDLPTLVRSNEIIHVKVEGRTRYALWETFVRQLGEPTLNVERGVVFDTANLAAQYAMSGDGLALVDPMLFEEDIHAGRLVRPFATDADEGYGYFLKILPEDLSDPAIATFRAWLIRRFTMAKSSSVTSPTASAGRDRSNVERLPMRQ